MQRAPVSLSYPVVPDRVAGMLSIACLLICAWMLYRSVGSAHAFGLGFVVSIGLGIWVVVKAMRRPFNAGSWVLEPMEPGMWHLRVEPPAPGRAHHLGRICRVWDFQAMMLLCLSDTQGAKHWVWMRASARPDDWAAMRRALVGAQADGSRPSHPAENRIGA